MPKTPLDFMAMARDREEVYDVRSRYYAALRSGVSKKAAFTYANDPNAKLPDETAETAIPYPQAQPKPPEPPKPLPIMEEPIVAPPEAAHPEPTPKELEERKEVAEEAASDDLERINGIGPGTHKRLNAMGVTSFAQVAAWTDADIGLVDESLNLRGRVRREDWVGQAKKLAG